MLVVLARLAGPVVGVVAILTGPGGGAGAAAGRTAVQHVIAILTSPGEPVLDSDLAADQAEPVGAAALSAGDFC